MRSGRRRGWLLALMSAASTVMPLSDAIYFPSLGAIGAELGAPQALAVTSIFSYMFAVRPPAGGRVFGRACPAGVGQVARFGGNWPLASTLHGRAAFLLTHTH